MHNKSQFASSFKSMRLVTLALAVGGAVLFAQASTAITMPKMKPATASSTGFSTVAATTTSENPTVTQQAKSVKKVSRSVVDQANILNQDSEFRLTKALGQFQLERGVQVVVLTTASLRGYDIEKYSAAVSKQWGVAAVKEKPGVLVVVAPNEKFVKIRVGPGLDEWMPNEVANHLIQKFMVPAFAKSDWQGGIVRGSAGIIAVLGRDKPIQLTELNAAQPAAIAAPVQAPATEVITAQTVATNASSMASATPAAVTTKSSNVSSLLIWPMLLLLLAFAALGLFWYRGRQVEIMAGGSDDAKDELKHA